MMQILIKRTWLGDDSTRGYMHVKPSEQDGWTYLCDTLEPHAIPWHDDPFIGQKAERRIAGRTAIPEGRYSLGLQWSDSYKREVICINDVPRFRSVFIRNGDCVSRTRGDILLPSLTGSRRLLSLVRLALERGEEVSLRIVSHKDWTY